MKTLRNYVAAFMSMTLAVIAASCAGQPSVNASVPTVTVQVIARDELQKKWGNLATTNPFLEPSTLLLGQPNEFVVLEVDFELPSRSRLDLTALIEDADGTQIAWAKDASAFSEYWSSWEKTGDSTKRNTKLESNCIPGLKFTYPRGKYSYVVVLVGKNPLPRPAVIKVQALVPGIPPMTWDFPLENVPGKK